MKTTFIPIILFLGLITSCSGSNTATIIVSNKSGSEIRSLTVGVSDHKKTITNLMDGKSANLIFQGLHDSHYVLNGELNDGSIIHGEFGYVTSGMDFKDSVVIHEDGKVGSSRVHIK